VIAIVTGASSGIGAAVAKLFVKSGHTVVGLGRDSQKLEALARALGDKFEARPCDVTDKFLKFHVLIMTIISKDFITL
jgi:3-hydroxy acid dehydrogenase/malonic semialdehyde reductase